MTTSSTETIKIKGEGISLALLVWRRFHRQNTGYVERVLDMNPNLADLGPILPVGTVVTLPIDPTVTKPDEDYVVRLWD